MTGNPFKEIDKLVSSYGFDICKTCGGRFNKCSILSYIEPETGYFNLYFTDRSSGCKNPKCMGEHQFSVKGLNMARKLFTDKIKKIEGIE